MTSHTEGTIINKRFCTQRAEGSCQPCGNDYTKILMQADADPAVHEKVADPVAAFKFPRLIKTGRKKSVQNISQNAHHVLCVAEVTKIISRDKSLKTVLDNTVWCINRRHNMMALPLFCHTLNWYLFDESAGPRTKVGEFHTAGPPPFENLPNHDFDHGRYNVEVETDLKTLKGEVKKADHNLRSDSIKNGLDNLSTKFKKQLVKHGARGKGTHGNWIAACQGNTSKWYEPFSLATNPDDKRAFPSKVARNLDRLKKALALLK